MFRYLVRASLGNRLIVIMVAIITVAYGVTTLRGQDVADDDYSMTAQRGLAVDVFPDLNKGLVIIVTEASGLAAEEVEVLVTTPIEAAVRGVTGMTRILSDSQTGLSVVKVEFDWGIDVYKARQVVTERLAIAEERLPPDMHPLLMPISSYMGEILLVAMAGPNADPMVLRELADWVVAPRLQAIPGVSRVVPIGGHVRQYRISPDLLKMNHLGITFQDLETAITGFGGNTGGGFVDQSTQEYLIRNMGRTSSLADLRNINVEQRNGQPVLLHQIAEVSFLPKQRRGNAGYQGRPAVILSIQKQPSADTLLLTKRVEKALRGMRGSMPDGVRPDLMVFRQANFINASVENVQRIMIEAIAAVAVILFLFLANTRTTAISLVAIPMAVLMTFIVFRWTGMSINTMTLGGIAIAIGELVDDAVVDVENIYRRLAENRLLATPRSVLAVITDASQEIRSGIVYSTMIIVLVFIPVFSIPGLEGQLFVPLGVAYIVSILSSLIISITLTPVLASLMLPRMRTLSGHQGWLVVRLKRLNGNLLNRVFDRPRPLLTVVGIAVFMAISIVPTLPRAFLPPFNESSLLVHVTLDPGISLEESSRIGRTAELLMKQIPEVTTTGRRTGRSERDQHALGVNRNEFEVGIELADRRMETIMREVRSRLAGLPGIVDVGQPISHRLIHHILTGAPGELVIKIFGDDLDVLRTLAGDVHRRLSVIPGVVDLMIEKQVPVPQIQIRVDPRQARLYGIQPGPLTRRLGHMINGATVSQVVDGERYFDVVIRLDDAGRDVHSLAAMLIDTSSGAIPLSRVAKVEISNGPNLVRRENGRRRIIVTANGEAASNARLADDVRRVVDNFPLPTGYFSTFEGIYAEQTRSALRLLGLASISLSLIFAVLYLRYRSVTLAMIIMGNVPLSLIGCVLALKLTGLELSVASMIGFITLTGISTRNGILKISHYINLVLQENESFGRKMVLRGSQERLVPVLMTAASACFGLLPLLIMPNAPGKEILYPMAVVIFGGLLVATFLDSLLTPLLFLRFGRASMERLASQDRAKDMAETY